MIVRNPQHNNNIFFAEIFDTDIKRTPANIMHGALFSDYDRLVISQRPVS